jgi:hypothetical protein
MKTRTSLLAAMAAITTFASMATTPVMAGSDYIDWSCSELWEARNQIYKNSGYCFKTQRAKEYYGNGGCSNRSTLSASDRREVAEIRSAEKAKGCRG